MIILSYVVHTSLKYYIQQYISVWNESWKLFSFQSKSHILSHFLCLVLSFSFNQYFVISFTLYLSSIAVSLSALFFSYFSCILSVCLALSLSLPLFLCIYVCFSQSFYITVCFIYYRKSVLHLIKTCSLKQMKYSFAVIHGPPCRWLLFVFSLCAHMELIRHFDFLKAFGYIEREVNYIFLGKDPFYIIRAQHVLCCNPTPWA